MRRIGWLFLTGFACVYSAAGSATIYKCKGPHGGMVYQDMPCADTSRTERTYHFHDDTPSGSDVAAEQTNAWRRNAQQFAQQHPDLGYGQNVALMNEAMRAVASSQMSNRQILEAGYAKAKSMPGWSSGTPRTQRSSSNQVAQSPSSDHVGGLGVSAYASGDIHAVRCTTVTGRVYYAKGVCGTTTVTKTVAGRDWHDDTVPNMPGAVMVGPNEALNPRTGQVVELQNEPETTAVHVTTRDRAQSVSTDEACAKVQAAEAKHPYSKKITRKVSELCQQGRSLYDEKPSRGSLYYSGEN